MGVGATVDAQLRARRDEDDVAVRHLLDDVVARLVQRAHLRCEPGPRDARDRW